MQTVYVIDTIRTPIGKYGGSLSGIRPDDLLAHVISALIKRNSSIDVNAIEDVIAGAANQRGEDNRNVARMAALLADCGGGGGSDSMYADAQAALCNQIAARHANVPAMLH